MKNAPLKALRFFESSARYMSFKAAGEELNVTPAAVGQQIKTLENFLGVQLFERLTRSIALTKEGHAILPGIQEALGKIDETLNIVQQDKASGILSVTTVHSFAAKWLFPRLGGFSLAHPDIDVRLTATRKVMSFFQDDIDVAIRIAPLVKPSSEIETIRLMDEAFIPVCSPDLLKGERRLEQPDDLRHFTLIHDDTMKAYDDCKWQDWLDLADVSGIDTERGPRFNPSTMPIQAATNGLGVALARVTLVQDDLETGRLIAPFDQKLPSLLSYYLMYPKNSKRIKEIEMFRDWIVEQVSTFEK